MEFPDEVAARQPVQHAESREQEVRLRVAIEILGERDRQLLVWREWEKLSFAEIAARLQIDAEAARAAARRAVERLRDTMTRLRTGDVDGALGVAMS